MNNMNASRKPFDQGLHDKNDPPAILALQQLFEGSEYYVEQHPQRDETSPEYKNKIGNTGIDVAIRKIATKEIHMYIDVEVKADWYGKSYPFSTVHFLERKAKYAPSGPYARNHFRNKPACWVLFNNDFTQHLLVVIADAVTQPIVRLNTREGTKREPFHDIPLGMCKFGRLSKLIKKSE